MTNQSSKARPGFTLGRVADGLRHDVRQTIAGLARRPGFTSVVVLTLAVGIGANTAIFSVVQSVLLAPLPYPDPERLVFAQPYPWVPVPAVQEWMESGRRVEEVVAFYPRRFVVAGEGGAESVEGAEVTPGFFAIFGASVALGRPFSLSDQVPESPPTAVISHAVWQRRFSGSADVIGRTIDVNGEPHAIIGVMPENFRVLAPRTAAPEVWVPLRLVPFRPDGEVDYVIPLARLAPGVTLAQGQAELDVISGHLDERVPRDGGRKWNLRVGRLRSGLVDNVRSGLVLLQAAVGLLLLIACANVANLMLARLAEKQRDLAVRAALGASPGRLLGQLLSESVVLSIAGGLAGLLLTAWALTAILALAPIEIPRVESVSINGPVLLFTLLVSIATGLFFGVAPALAVRGGDLYRAVREGGRTSGAMTRRHRMSRLLVVSEFALALSLLTGAGLLVNSFLRLNLVDPGFSSERVLTARLRLPENRYDGVAPLDAFYEQVLERLGGVPGVELAALSNNLPQQRSGSSRELGIEGGAEEIVVDYGVVSSDYFRVLGIPLLRGRYFDERDRSGAPGVAIVDDSMRRAYWGDGDPIGARIRFSGAENDWLTVVGVVADTKGGGLGAPPRPGFYIPHRQRPDTFAELAVGRNAVLLVATAGDPAALAASMRAAVREVSAGQPLDDIAFLDDVISQGMSPERFRTFLLGVFSGVALLLAVAGIYGVIAHVVAERTREFGLRIALGASPSDVIALVMKWGLSLTALGSILGIVFAIALTRYLASFLFGISTTDPPTFVAAVAVLALAAALACYVPARRATRVDPMESLRAE